MGPIVGGIVGNDAGPDSGVETRVGSDDIDLNAFKDGGGD